MHLDQLRDFRRIAGSIDTFLRKSYREPTHPGPDPQLAELLNRLLPEYGRYVDIGANDPIQISNTWPLYARGWTGLLIEPDPGCWPRILRHRPNDCLWPTAVSDRVGHAILRADDSGVSSIEPDWPCPENAVLVAVELLPTHEVLQMFSNIRNECRLCSVDVEGHEAAVLRGIDFTVFRPEVFVVESLRYDPECSHEPTWPEWEPILLQNGYRFHWQTGDGVNRVYIREGSNAERLADVEIRSDGSLG